MNQSPLRRMRDQSTGKATLINEGCKISGEITGDGDFIVNGEVAGDCDIKGTVTLARNGFCRRQGRDHEYCTDFGYRQRGGDCSRRGGRRRGCNENHGSSETY